MTTLPSKGWKTTFDYPLLGRVVMLVYFFGGCHVLAPEHNNGKLIDYFHVYAFLTGGCKPVMEGSLVRKLPRISKFQRREPWGYLSNDQTQKELILRTSSLQMPQVWPW